MPIADLGRTMATGPTYFIAPFDVRGELVGLTTRQLSDLAPDWLEFWKQLIGTHGATFQVNLPIPPLQHIAVKLTSTEGAALITFTVRGTPASSAIALSGLNAAAESEILGMWVESLKRVRLVQQAARSETTPFQSAFGLTERPLYLVVSWPLPQIADSDQELVQELQTHLAAALLCGATTPHA
jgi:hypothetical protein